MKPHSPEESLPQGEVIWFSDAELMDLRRLLLPNRMARHDSSAEKKIRSAAARAKVRRGGRPSYD